MLAQGYGARGKPCVYLATQSNLITAPTEPYAQTLELRFSHSFFSIRFVNRVLHDSAEAGRGPYSSHL